MNILASITAYLGKDFEDNNDEISKLDSFSREIVLAALKVSDIPSDATSIMFKVETTRSGDFISPSTIINISALFSNEIRATIGDRAEQIRIALKRLMPSHEISAVHLKTMTGASSIDPMRGLEFADNSVSLTDPIQAVVDRLQK